MGKRSNPPQQTTTSTNLSSPWEPQGNYLKEIFHNAQHNYVAHVNDKYYPGQTYANFNPTELDALNMAEQRARNGSSNLSAVRNYSMGILNNDPATLANTLGPRVGELLPQLQNQFNRAGMGASSLARSAEQELIARELSKLKESAADRLERLIPQEYADISKLAAVGETRRDMEQKGINDAIANYEYEQNAPWQKLANYMGMITGNYGGAQSGIDKTYGAQGSRLSGLLGGASKGAGIGESIGGPWGAGIGGILGGLGGMYF